MQITLYNIYNLITWDIWLEEIQDLRFNKIKMYDKKGSLDFF